MTHPPGVTLLNARLIGRAKGVLRPRVRATIGVLVREIEAARVVALIVAERHASVASEQRPGHLHLDLTVIDRRGQDIHQFHALIIGQQTKRGTEGLLVLLGPAFGGHGGVTTLDAL